MSSDMTMHCLTDSLADSLLHDVHVNSGNTKRQQCSPLFIRLQMLLISVPLLLLNFQLIAIG